MKNKRLLILGVFALVVAVGLNVRHALNDYGVKDSKLHIEALANTTGDITIGSLCMQSDDFCVEEPIDIDPYWYFTYPFRNL